MGGSKAITISELQLEEHIRYAHDKRILDATLTGDSQRIAPHAAITSLSALYPSQLVHLFALQQQNVPWASFTLPENYLGQPRRFFVAAILPRCPRQWKEMVGQKMAALAALEGEDAAEQQTLLDLLSALSALEEMLATILAHKSHYQKG